MVQRLLVIALFLLSAFAGCSPSGRKADISNIEQQVNFLNLQQALSAADFNQQEVTHQQLYQTFGSFWHEYTEFILQVGAGNDPGALAGVADFLAFHDTRETEAAILEVHGHLLEGYTHELDYAFRRFRYFFKDTSLPDVVFYNSGFNFAIFPGEAHLGVGLDFFLGAEHPITKRLNPELFPGYMQQKMHPGLVVTDALRGWLLVHHQDAYYDETNLISTCIYWGKMLYLLDLMLPDTPDHIKMGYTEEEQRWCKENERNLWIEFSQQDIVYETRRFEINRWVVDGPFTRAAGVPQESPSRVGVWLGWQIVRDYMNRNRELTPAELLADRNYLGMLNAYRPS